MCYHTFCVRGTFRLNGQSHHTLALDIFLAVKKVSVKEDVEGEKGREFVRCHFQLFTQQIEMLVYLYYFLHLKV